MSEGNCARHLRLRPAVFVATGADGQVALLRGAGWGEHIGVLSAGQRELLGELAADEHPEAALLDRFGPGTAALLDRLRAGGWLTARLSFRNRSLITVRPLGPHLEPRAAPLRAPRLSRFALMRRAGDELVLESPRCRASVEIHDLDVLTVLHRMAGSAEPCVPAGLTAGVVAELVGELAWYGFVRDAEEDMRADLTTEQWSPHELWFHARSRAGYHDEPFGLTRWADGRHAPLPARRAPWAVEAALPLPVPDGAERAGMPFAAVLEARRSVREPDDEHPLTVAQLGEFLHQAAGVRRVLRDDRNEVSLRPSPSGGALHGLEIYPVVTQVTGLASGMYHYDPFGHRLEPVPAAEPAVRQLVWRAAEAAGGGRSPHVLLVCTARFGRVMWKYQSMAYALILKDLGALLQTMYLVATAMNLAPCAIGTGDSDLFAQATALNPLEEASVGEFMLSSRTT
ncbi:MAG TPA: SagB family peptide dehydrogenase [Actinophytocola sp.]|uniref:SagB/ThcOx family dehydrogenase n=1 Tax=Actinophytocola sp. TaxID=1872138 RepID=UPI002DBC8907|nr:SagB family peptide dehydrogenase [Actinophytocola sp.]HEU5469587.1 SagB family peptide dehydrogenase [Actinophytocola sp.]